MFSFRVEADGSVARACAEKTTPMLDEQALRCMLDVLLTLHYPAMDPDETELCGLFHITYPVEFEP